MADVFLSYASSDRPRAETIGRWLESCGFSVWMDRQIDLGQEWDQTLLAELEAAALVIVIWGTDSRHSDWVCKEAELARGADKLLQVHATGLPLLAPFNSLQAVRMQAWSGEEFHSERVKLLATVAERLDRSLPENAVTAKAEEALPDMVRLDVVEAFELVFYFCARQVERVRKAKERGHALKADFDAIGPAFEEMNALLKKNASEADDREGILHRMMEDFLDELDALSPAPGRLS